MGQGFLASGCDDAAQAHRGRRVHVPDPPGGRARRHDRVRAASATTTARRARLPASGWDVALPACRTFRSVSGSPRRRWWRCSAQGRHPNAEEIEQAARLAGKDPQQIDGPAAWARRIASSSRPTSSVVAAPRGSATTTSPVGWTPSPRFRRRTAPGSAPPWRARCSPRATAAPPADARELSGHLARISRQATTAVAGYDLTFSPGQVRLDAVGARPAGGRRAGIEQAHAAAVADTLAWLEDHATYTRVGRNGVRQVEVRGLIAAAFTHRDSRAGDPDLHTHVAVSNKVQTLDGRWLALDGRLSTRPTSPPPSGTTPGWRRSSSTGSASASPTVPAPSRASGRSGRSSVSTGHSPRLWSSRRRAIDVRRAALARQFQADHGRPPTTVEAMALAQQANLETRQAKHEPRSDAEQRATWRAQAIADVGRRRAACVPYLDGVLRGTRGRATAARRARGSTETAQQVLAAVSSARRPGRRTTSAPRPNARSGPAGSGWPTSTGRSTRSSPPRCHPRCRSGWTAARHGQAAVGRARRAAPLRRHVGLRGRRLGAVHLERRSSPPSSASSPRPAGATASHPHRGRRDRAAGVGAPTGSTLNPGQAQLVRELATSGARVQLALAPAGTGKTTALRALARAWRAGGGDRRRPRPVRRGRHRAARADRRRHRHPGQARSTR